MIRLISTGSYLPANIVTNDDLLGFPKHAIPLIKEKTGVESRHRCSESEFVSDLATSGARNCLEKADINPADIDAIVLSTSTPDRLIPATATRVGDAISATNAFCFDMNSVCSGSVFSLEVARGLLMSGSAKTVLVINADAYSKFLNPKDFSTFPYFGDGCGVALLSSSENMIQKSIWSIELGIGHLRTDGSGYETITIPVGGSELPSHVSSKDKDKFFQMDGRKVFDFAVEKGTETIIDLLRMHKKNLADISQVILHQANVNIVDAIAANTGIGADKFFVNLDRVGNCAGASILIALDEYLSSHPVVKGKCIVQVGFGGGLSWGGSLLAC